MMQRQSSRVVLGIVIVGCSQTVGPTLPDAADDRVLSGDVPPPPAPCAEGLLRCNDTCVDVTTSLRHCGACGRMCAADALCERGVCVPRCTAPATWCEGAPDDGCVDTQAHPSHCGACGKACAAGERCNAGTCVPTCPTGQTDCDGVCRDLSTDRVSCGACGNLCPTGNSCVEGACVVVCTSGRSNCGGRCVDLQTANDHCGACERRCAPGTRCTAGVCRGDPCGPTDSTSGRCDGNAVLRCIDDAVVREACGFGEVCDGDPPRCAAPMGPRRVTGRVTYQFRPAGPSGVGSLRYEPLVGAPVELLDPEGRVLVQGLTREDGTYSLGHGSTEGEMLRVRVTLARNDAHYNFVVRDYANATFAFTTMPFPAGTTDTRDVAIPVEGNAGAASIFSTVRQGFDFMRPYLTARPAALYVTWQRGRATGTNQSSYFVGTSSTIFVNGSESDPDEFDPSVIAHEFGHYIQRWYSRTSNPGGPHDGRPADPNLAFGEGGASFLGALITGSRYYIDAGVSRLRLLQDLQAIPMYRVYMANPSLPMEQPISEWLVAGVQYAMFRASTRVEQQTERAMRVLTGYLRRNPYPDRGEPGVDLVEYLDGYLCIHAGAERNIIMNYLVTQRGFPYDFGYTGVCR